jgi:LmbE family N-acetylglucosaminyl deacetylase
MKHILVVAAHSADEALGCGGTIAKIVEKGHRVTCVFLTDGVGARLPDHLALETKSRRAAADAAGRRLGITSSIHFDFPDNRLDVVPLLDVVRAIEKVLSEQRPDVIYTHQANDLNVDHRICHQAVLTATRPQPGQCTHSIFGFEVSSSSEWSFSSAGFTPNYFVDISDQLPIKLQALAEYGDEIREPPHPRSRSSVEALARWRGSTVGCVAAEAFTVIRQVIREF